VFCDFYAPADNLAERAHKDRVPYDLWHKQGYLNTTTGPTVDYEFIAYRLAELDEMYGIQALKFDRWRMKYLRKELDRLGIELPLVDHGQGYVSMAPALDSLEVDLLNGNLRHGNHPVLTWNAANAVVERDAAGNRKLNKAKSTGRIDGMVALAMTRDSFEDEGDINEWLASL
jgi:phage terminase large subunit-like protein